ncbi:DUF637 domain-containing protein [Photorhabdus temperata subsp. temperata]
MDQRNTPVVRATSYLLIYLTAVYPLHPAIAAGITPDNSQTQVQNQGNVPVVNIATPNDAGISHNTYQEFNVATQGAVLNNATQTVPSQLAGQLNANPNLNGKAAELIINEVTGNGRSELQGQLEIVGNKANVMIANPNGITCDGCGFINTASATLTTGKPQFDKQGALEALEVKQGQITIGGKGLDGKATDYVDIISRATELNGKIQANTLSLTQGANRISLKDGTINALAGEGAKPQLAIDTKALGGMYANKIRLVATEDGVGVNLKELTSDQRDITLNANGKIELGNTKAKTDLNIIGKETDIAPNITVQAGQDITLANTTLENKGSVTAGRDMRVFGDTVRNTGDKALLQANDNLWIQKDAQGNKGQLVENRSATIKTVKGDLVVRTHKLNNVRDVFTTQWHEKKPDSQAFTANVLGNGWKDDPNLLIIIEPYLNNPPAGKWFGHVNIKDNPQVNDSQKTLTITGASPEAQILAGNHLYLNGDQIVNAQSKIAANKNLIMTGNRYLNSSVSLGSLHGFTSYVFPEINEHFRWKNGIGHSIDDAKKQFPDMELEPIYVNLIKQGENTAFYPSGAVVGTVSAGENFVADFNDDMTFDTPSPIGDASLKERGYNGVDTVVSANNIVLHAKNIRGDSGFQAKQDFSAIAENNLHLQHADLQAGHSLSLLAVNNLSATQTVLGGKDINLITRQGDIRFSEPDIHYYDSDGQPHVSQLNAREKVTLKAGNNIHLENVAVAKNTQLGLYAGRDIQLVRNESRLTHAPLSKSPADYKSRLKQVGGWESAGDIVISAGNTLQIQGLTLNAGQSISLHGGQDIDLSPRVLNQDDDNAFRTQRRPEMRTQLLAGHNLTLNAARDIHLQGTNLQAKNQATVLAGRNMTLGALPYSAIAHPSEEHQDERHQGTDLRGEKGLTLAANGFLTTQGSTLNSAGHIMLSSGGNMRFESVRNHTSGSGTERYTPQGTEINSGGYLTMLSGGSILFQATKLMAKGAIDIAAQGGFLYAQAMEETYRWEEKKKSCKKVLGIQSCTVFGSKTETRRKESATNKVTEFTADGNINLLAKDDVTLEAARINTQKNAGITSRTGQVNFKAVKNTTFEQTITESTGFFITHSDKGYIENTWVLPAIHFGGKLTVEAANGINADIKAQKGQSLQNAVSIFGNTPETAWLKGLNERQDVQWNLVKDAYDRWDYKSQHLNPVVSAVIAIAVATVTAGAGITASVAGSAAGTAGSAATTAGATASTAATVGSMAYGATTSGMAALASQAAVALVDNQGDLSKTLKAMGSSDTVKSTLTSMVMGGALAGFDTVMGWDNAANGAKLDPSKAKLPSLSNGDWSKVAQRVAGQSIISSSLGTTINGGSFKDNFTTALLANIGKQINAEGANLIGKNGQILGLPGKAISHAAVSALAAEMGGGNAKGAAAGALAAELAAITLDKTFSDPMSIQAGGKIIGGVAGAIATNSAEGANSGANAGEIVILFNHLHSMSVYNLTRELQEANKQGASTEAIWNKYGELSAAQRAEMLSDCAGNGGLCTLTYQAEMEGGIKTADAVSGLRWMFDLSEEDAHRLSQFVTTENQNDLGLLYNSLPAWEKGALIAKEAVESAGIGGAVGKVSVASIVGKNKQPYQPNQGAVGNMGEFFRQSGFGSQMKNNARKTNQIYDGQSVYQVKGDVGEYISKGDKYYLDGMHKNHIEVFDSKHKIKAVLNLDGSLNRSKTDKAIEEGRRLPK